MCIRAAYFFPVELRVCVNVKPLVFKRLRRVLILVSAKAPSSRVPVSYVQQILLDQFQANLIHVKVVGQVFPEAGQRMDHVTITYVYDSIILGTSCMSCFIHDAQRPTSPNFYLHSSRKTKHFAAKMQIMHYYAKLVRAKIGNVMLGKRKL